MVDNLVLLYDVEIKITRKCNSFSSVSLSLFFYFSVKLLLFFCYFKSFRISSSENNFSIEVWISELLKNHFESLRCLQVVGGQRLFLNLSNGGIWKG